MSNNRQQIRDTIFDNPGVAYSELYHLVRLHGQTVKKYLKELERDGIIRREHDETSNRKVRLYSTLIPESISKTEKAHSCPCCGTSGGEMESQQRIRDAIQANPGVTYDELEDLLGQTVRTIKKYIARLRRIGLVRCEYDETGRGKARFYSQQEELIK